MKEIINENELELVAGGKILMDKKNGVVTYTDANGNKTKYTIKDFDNAWDTAAAMYRERQREDAIVETLVGEGYIG